MTFLMKVGKAVLLWEIGGRTHIPIQHNLLEDFVCDYVLQQVVGVSELYAQ